MKLALLAMAALVVHGGTAAAPAPPLRLTGPVKELAADGGRVAVLLQTSRPGCTVSRVAVWQPSTRSLAPIGASPCSESLSTGAGIFSVALARSRVAYVQYGGGNIRELELRSATLAARRPVTLASASFGLDELSGTYIGRIAGDGSLLAFDWWNVCPACAGNAGPEPDRSAVWRVAGTGACPNAGLGSKRLCTVVRAGIGTLRLLSAAAGSLALLQAEGSVAVVTAAGATTATIPFAAGELRAARLDSDGRRLVALVSAGGAKNALRVYDATGALAATYPLPAARTSGDATCDDPNGCKTPALRLEDVDSGIAVYVLGAQIHLLRLADGKTATIRPPGRTPVHAQLEPDGLYYSYSLSAKSSRVAFMPFAKLPWGA